MKYIELIKELELNSNAVFAKDKEVNELFNGPFRKLVEVRLQNGATLSKHKANEPITVLMFSRQRCISGGCRT